ncbi:hypothetical protein Hdeb2414_s0001g00021581 [Helianthus debilis subsp. tardiflorus]
MGFSFVTFAEDGVADRVSRRSHEICGKPVLDRIYWFCICNTMYTYLIRRVVFCDKCFDGLQVAIDSATHLDNSGQAEAAATIWTTHLNQRTYGPMRLRQP